MSELDISKADVLERGMDSDTTQFTQSYEVASESLEYGENGETIVNFPNAAKYNGLYKKYGQIKAAINTLALYVCGKGYDTETTYQNIMDYWKGWGEDTSHAIFWNMQVESLKQGDSFAEIVRETDYEGNERIINLKPIAAERMRIVLGPEGTIIRYEIKKKGKVTHKFDPKDIFHICNDRVGDEQRGTSVIECCEWAINAIEEARRDYRILLHRNVVPVRIIEIDNDDTIKRNAFKTEYKDAIRKGEVLLIPKGTVEIKDTKIQIQDPIAWIQSLENYLYIAGIPRVIASPDDLSEGSSKIGYLLFEPIYSYRQTLLEADIWNQLQIRLTFHRPPSLMDSLKSNEAKNTSQTGMQPKEATATMERE